MKNNSLIIMAGGSSSRMKKSLQTSSLDDSVKKIASEQHKSLIPLNASGRPLLFYLLTNAASAGIKNVYLITSKQNGGFYDFVEAYGSESGLNQLEIKFSIQHMPQGREKPLGTADALQQCMDQHQNLLQESFTVCNGDNLYSVGAFEDLSKPRKVPSALIAYSGQALGHSDEKIAKFALIDFSEERFLTDIIEKPTASEWTDYTKKHKELWVSMNIFNFYGSDIYPYLENCPIHPERNEKELPEAVRFFVSENADKLVCIPRAEKIPDLTNANDIKNMNLYL